MNFIIFFLISTSFAAMDRIDFQNFDSKILNLVKNPGFENGLWGWWITAGTMTQESSTIRRGKFAVKYVTTASGQRMCSYYVTPPSGTTSCYGAVYYRTSSANFDLTIYRWFGSVQKILTLDLTASASAYKRAVTSSFDCTLTQPNYYFEICLEDGTGGATSTIYADDFFVGEN